MQNQDGQVIAETDIFSFPGDPEPPIIIAPRARYGEQRGINWPAIILIIFLHAALFGAIMFIRSEIAQKPENRLTLMDLMPAAAPPSPEKQTPRETKPDIVVPPPLVRLPQPDAPPLATTPDITPAPPEPAQTSEPAPSAPPSPPAPRPAPGVVHSGDMSTTMISAVPPRYPYQSRRDHEEGTVVLNVTLGLDGRVASISIASSSGSSHLDQAALRAVRRWRWSPTIRNGQPVRVKGQVRIPFILQN